MFPYILLWPFKIPTYGFMMMLGITIAFILSLYRCKRAKLLAEDLFIIVACGIGIGLFFGSLSYVVITYSWQDIIHIVKSRNIIGLFNGGLIFYFSLIGGIIGAYIGSRIAKAKLLDFLNPIIPTIPLAHAFGRIGCFCAGCCYGCPTTSPIGVVYANPVGGAPKGINLFPVQLVESFLNLILFVMLVIYTRKTRSKTNPTYLYCFVYAVIRFILEFYRYDKIRGILFGLSTSQLISIAIILVILVLYLMNYIRSYSFTQKDFYK